VSAPARVGVGIAHYASVMRRQGFLAVPAVVLAMLLAGCQASPTDDLQDELAGIPGVESVYVDASRVKATLDADIVAADAETAIVALRDQAVAGHSLGDEVELVVVIGAGSRDFGGAQPWEVYSYGKWSFGAAAGAAASSGAGVSTGASTPLTANCTCRICAGVVRSVSQSARRARNAACCPKPSPAAAPKDHLP